MTPTKTAAILGRLADDWRHEEAQLCKQFGDVIPTRSMRARRIKDTEAIDAAVEMIDRLEAAEKERDALRAAVRHEADCVEAAKAEIKALRSELVDLRSSMAFRTSLVGRTEAERDTLRAKIEAMEKQEPVMWANSSNINSSRINKERGGRGDQHTCSETQTTYHHAPLYALPGAQTQGEEK